MKMKKLSVQKVFKCIVIVAISMNSFAQGFMHQDKIEKKFHVSTETTIELNNKYGTVNIDTWEKDSLIVVIDLTIRSKNQVKLDKVINNIDFEFVDTKYYASAKTVFMSSRNSLMSEISELADSYLQSGNSVEINYLVKLPSKSNLSITNKFGDIYIGDTKGEVDITLSHGNLLAHDFKGKTNLKLKFGNANINKFSHGKIDLSYEEIDIEEIDDANITSKSSKLDLGDLNTIRLKSKRDVLYVSSVKSINAELNATEFNLKGLQNKFDGSIKYGNLEISNISNSFSEISVISKYSNIKLNFKETHSFKFNAKHQKSNLKYPESFTNLSKELVDEKSETYRTIGKVGNSNANSSIKLDCTSGNIEIKQR